MLMAGAALAVPCLAGSAGAATEPLFHLNRANILGQVRPTMFGANILAPSDDVNDDFGRRVMDFAPTILRWPGGTIAEKDFNPASPDQNMVTTIRAFLSFCGAHAIRPAIVLPTIRYLNRMADIAREIGGFIRNLTRGKYGATRIEIIEIGNEFYVGGSLSPEEYGRIAARIAAVVRRNAAYPVKISIQGGMLGSGAVASAATVAKHVAANNFDLVSVHCYLSDEDAAKARYIPALARALGGKPVFLSEWNVKSCANPSETGGSHCGSQSEFDNSAFGMKQAGAMVAHFAAHVAAGVRYATVWPVQQNNMTSFYPNEWESGSDRYIGGDTFAWLRETARTAMFDIRRPTGTPVIMHGFESSGRLHVLIRSRTAIAGHVRLDAGGIRSSDWTLRRLSGPSGVKRLVAESDRVEASYMGGVFRIPVNARSSHELLKLTIRL